MEKIEVGADGIIAYLLKSRKAGKYIFFNNTPVSVFISRWEDNEGQVLKDIEILPREFGLEPIDFTSENEISSLFDNSTLNIYILQLFVVVDDPSCNKLVKKFYRSCQFGDVLVSYFSPIDFYEHFQFNDDL